MRIHTGSFIRTKVKEEMLSGEVLPVGTEGIVINHDSTTVTFILLTNKRQYSAPLYCLMNTDVEPIEMLSILKEKTRVETNMERDE